MSELKNISEAIINVMKEVHGMEKNSHVGTGLGKYDGTKDQDVKEVFNAAMVKHNLCIVTIDIEAETKIDRWEDPQYKKMKQSVFTTVKVKYVLIHSPSGESITGCGYGHGVDPQDKGAGMATTYALKNFLLLMGLTPVGKIPDTDTTHSYDIDTPPSVSVKQPWARQISNDTQTRTKPEQKKIISLKDYLKEAGLKKAVITKEWGEGAYYDILLKFGYLHATDANTSRQMFAVLADLNKWIEDNS